MLLIFDNRRGRQHENNKNFADIAKFMPLHAYGGVQADR